MQGFLRMIRGARAQHTWFFCALVGTLACSGPRQFGRSSSAPMPSSLSGGSPVLAQRAPTMLRRPARTVRFAPPLYADETKEGEPWSGLQLAMQPSPEGIFVGNVSRGSPAEVAGIQAGDHIFQLDGQTARDALDVLAEISRVGVGGSLRLGVHRGERVRLFRIEPVARPAQAAAADPPAEPARPSAALEGEAPASVTPATASPPTSTPPPTAN